MNKELFTAKLAEKTKRKEVELAIFLETFVLGFATKLQATKKASFDPFGVFEISKRVEYIDERADGTKVLYPPCLEVEFSSSAIWGVLKLSEIKENQPIYDLFAQRYEWEEEATALFISQIKSVIKSQLLKDRFCYIPGFGTFEGELGGDINFTPDSSFANLINKPFAYFKPVELSVSESELKTVVPTEELDVAEIVATEEEETEPLQEEEPIEAAEEETTETQEDITEEIEELATEEPTAEEEETEPLQEEEPTDAAEEETPDTQEDRTEEIEEPATEEPTAEEKEAEPLQEEELLVAGLETKLGAYDERLASIEQQLKKKDQSLRYYKNLALFLSVLIVGLLVFWYWTSTLQKNYFETFFTIDADKVETQFDEPSNQAATSSEPLVLTDSLAHQEPDSLQQDTVPELTHAENLARQEQALEEQKLLEQPKSSAETTASQAAKPPVAKQLIQHRLKAGETLRGLALRYYGSKDKWKLILDANKQKIKNPDVIPEGTLLMIPKLD